MQRVLIRMIKREGAREFNDGNNCNNVSNEAQKESDETYLDDLDTSNNNESLLDDDENNILQPNANKEVKL